MLKFQYLVSKSIGESPLLFHSGVMNFSENAIPSLTYVMIPHIPLFILKLILNMILKWIIPLLIVLSIAMNLAMGHLKPTSANMCLYACKRLHASHRHLCLFPHIMPSH